MAYYEWVSAAQGFKVPKHLLPVIYGLCDTRIRKLMLIVGPGSGKSQMLSVIYPSWVIGHNPQETVLAVSAAEHLAQGFLSAVMDIVQFNEAFRELFPTVTPDKEAGWSTVAGAYVKGRIIGIPDASFWAAGLASKAIVGKHATTIILDDLHSGENSANEELCKGVINRYYDTLLGRADPRGARFVLAGRRWHESDIYGHLQNSEEWVVMTLPAERKGANLLYHDIYVPDGMECVFTDRMCHCADGEVVRV